MLWLSALLAAPVEPNAHIPWLVKLLGGMDPNAAALGITVVGGALGTVAISIYVKWVKAKRELAMLAVPPSAPVVPPVVQLPAPVHVHSPVVVFELEERVARTEWSLDEARKRCRELEQSLRDVGADAARTAQSLSGERHARELLEKQVADLRRALAASERRALQMADELADLKRDLNSGHTHIGNVTPLRPPKSTR